MRGEIAAGFPASAEEELCDIISFDEYLVARPDSSFLLKVHCNVIFHYCGKASPAGFQSILIYLWRFSDDVFKNCPYFYH